MISKRRDAAHRKRFCALLWYYPQLRMCSNERAEDDADEKHSDDLSDKHLSVSSYCAAEIEASYCLTRLRIRSYCIHNYSPLLSYIRSYKNSSCLSLCRVQDCVSSFCNPELHIGLNQQNTVMCFGCNPISTASCFFSGLVHSPQVGNDIHHSLGSVHRT